MNGSSSRGVTIDFSNLTVSVKTGQTKTKEIIHGIGGTFASGSLIGILGPSGAGKSTLLNALSGFNTTGMKGDIIINGKRNNMQWYRKRCSYIPQDNDLHHLLTVEENMKFAADLKLGETVDKKTKNKMINSILDTYSLSEIKDTPTSKISGGQKKRLSVALELISDPMVMFLDEPTTGLDSFTSSQCIENLKELANKGKTVVCTIHQPSATIFKQFDHVYILSEGRCLYQGGTENMLKFLEEIGMPCNLFHNPADFVLELANGEYGSDKIDMMIKYSENGGNRSYMDKYIEDVTNGVYQPLSGDLHFQSNTYELKTLFRREFVKLTRNLSLTYLRICATIINGFMISSIYWNLGENASKIWFNYNLVLCIVINLVMCGIMLTVIVFPMELGILQKEHFNRYFRLRSYYIAITILDLPISIFSTTVSNYIILYFTAQPMEMNRVLMVLSFGIMVGLIAQSIGLLLGSCLNLRNGVFVGSYVHMPLMLLSGFGLLVKDVPSYFNIIGYISYMRYAVSGMNVAIYGYNRKKLECPDDEFCYYTTGASFLKEMEIKDHSFWTDFSCMIAIYFGLRIATYFAITKRLPK
ncbi:PREDICTED: ATP-binding cassette sub-family G member 1-like [Nicrophorus vespilloides]|uniref:ATP-binding cassette sub-family G member 1-like n=1 Tax=Nicrophorus vespilloides TaxID=110193 RepID=A0ABM1MT77_NICVS|nr:PREDICTED: ATP-binding cassette sub-family G member 1-like [Nicrophorus vespilloides]